MSDNSDPARETAKSHVQSVWGVIRFLPGGIARMFGPLFMWGLTQPIVVRTAGKSTFNQLGFAIFALSIYWAYLHSKRFKE